MDVFVKNSLESLVPNLSIICKTEFYKIGSFGGIWLSGILLIEKYS